MNISRATVSQTCKHLEQNNLIKNVHKTRYNILYEVSVDLQKRIGGVQEQVLICRVHSIAMKFSILNQDKPFNRDKRTGYTHSWKLRGWEPSAYWFPGKAGEISCTVTPNPKSIVIRMDAGQKIFAKDEMEAAHKGYQHLIYVRQQFIEKQRLFGIDIEIEPTGQIVGKAHYGYPMPENHPAVQEIKEGKVPGWDVDDSLKKKRAQGVVEGETTIQAQASIMGQVLNLPKTLPDMIRDTINPIGADITAVKAMLQGGITQSQENDNIMKFLSSVLKEMAAMREEIRELKAKG